MIRRHATALRLGLATLDFAMAVAVFIAVSVGRYGPGWVDSWRQAAADPWLLALAYAAAWVAILWVLGLYRLRARWAWRTEVVDLLRAVLMIAILTFATLFVVKLPDVSRLLLVELFLAQATIAVVSRGVLRLLLRQARESGRNTRFVLVVGHGEYAHEYARRIERYPYLGLRIAGFLADPGPADPHPEAPASTPEPHVLWDPQRPGTLGRISEIETILRTRVIDEVAICLSANDAAFVEPVAHICEESGVIVRIPLFSGVGGVAGGRVEDFDGLRIQTLSRGPDRTLALVAKRLIDIAGASVALLVLSPILTAVALFILVRDGRPAIFSQVRVGVRGRPFTIYKFRTMSRDAEERYEAVAALSNTKGAAFKMTDDPRITPWGRVLRTTSIDELPQFINVLLGDMSIVGPRPAPPREVAGYDVWHRRRLSVKPGITGLWQVEARRDEDFDNRARLDLDYIDRWSLLLDLKIMARTVPAMLEGR
jgi:exopolysaccharide biosynthesis polyprenyl glycosylphosphotransferase